MNLARRERATVNRVVAAEMEVQRAEENKRLAELELKFAQTRLLIAELGIENATFERFLRESR